MQVQTELIQLIRNDPATFLEDGFGIKLWKKQREVVRLVRDNSKISVRSCHASGKSFIAGRIAVWFLHAFPDSIVLTTAPTFRQVQDVLWKEIRTAYYNSKADLAGEVLNTRYNISPSHFAVGLSTDEPDKFQGYHAKSMLIIIDESSGVPPNIFEAIQGVASTGHIKILELGNPTDPTGHFANTFKSQFYVKVSISCFDTPNFAPFPDIQSLRDSTEEQRVQAVVCPYLVTPQWVYERLIDWGENTPMFQARCLGEFPTEGVDTLVSLSNALQAVERNDLDNNEPEVLGVDIARYGSDKTVFAYRRGDNLISIDRYSKEDTMQTVGKINLFKTQHPEIKIIIDDSGVGGGVTDRLEEQKVDVEAVNVGTKSYESEKYINLRAELYHKLAKRFVAGSVSIPKDDLLVSELSSIKYRLNSKGQIQIESKDDMKKRGMKSPDSADAVMLAFSDIEKPFQGFLMVDCDFRNGGLKTLSF